ncbi:MAG: cation transporter [Candidatus Muproteobacteria bacterium RIFCSPHIGHO2_01_FULL_65_16]|uniref:Cation transporter n=1 Tax=Candidatus Muproteobacteria bacterium RIFCSPHIGHO2_01_FULL_65_16 TaxID=1817764 RepID=A0A1F6TIR1_9PROT|nr:MAG: cation transporter [Candidatus Muproteobacteria bacterium RIFCSPHIGHO2_01_FULL_65_16]
MISAIIRWSLNNRHIVLIVTAMLVAGGVYAVARTPLDAIPDLSDVQVIIKTPYPGQAPQVVEDQVTYPLATAMLSVPRATTVRGYSLFGDSFVYVIFEDGTDLYWARSRVLEYLSQAVAKLPRAAKPALGPDATGVGWVYEYALVDRSGRHDISQLRALQDWYLKYELRTVPGVAEVASVGGMVKQYQVVVDPARLRAFKLMPSEVRMAIERANQESGGSVIEMAEAEYMVRVRGYVQSLKDLREIVLGVTSAGSPIRLDQVAEIRLGPEMRRGITELDGAGEVAGGIVVMRHGENALAVIEAVRAKLDAIRRGLPEGVEIVTTYDRAALIERAIRNLGGTLIEEFVIVALVCAAFLFHLRSALVAIVMLPIGILVAFIVMKGQGINANIMSLGGIAIAVGAMVDAAIVMIENVHKHFERGKVTEQNRWEIVRAATEEVGPPLFFSLLIITVSFLPVFALQAQEGKLFAPLAFTKTYAMAAAAGLSVTLVPVLMGYFIRGRIRPEHDNPINRALLRAYRPALEWVLAHPRQVLAAAAALILITAVPLTRVGTEFMPDMDEGDILYMPTTLPGLSTGKAQQILQQTDRALKTLPEVKTVFGKAGRAETATDPSPLSMFETTIQLKPKSEWRPGMTTRKLIAEMNELVKFPGLSNVFVPPIKTRIDMLTTGTRTPVGVKVTGPALPTIERIGREIERVVRAVPGTTSVYAERLTGARYVDVRIDRNRAARFGLSIMDIQETVETAVGGMNVAETVEGRERYPVNVRYPADLRDSLERLKRLPILTTSGVPVALGDVVELKIADGPDMIRSENARLSGWIFVDFRDRDIGSYVAEAQRLVNAQVKLPPGYGLIWSGQYEYLQRALARLKLVIPFTLAIILFLLYLNFRNAMEVAIIVTTLPLALAGGLWLLWALGYNLSIAVAVGFIALGGVAAEIGVVMLTYLDQALKRRIELRRGRLSGADIREAVIEGALMRIRPIMMTNAAIIAGLLPILWSSGAGSEAMQRIAAPMVGGMVTVAVLTLAVIPAAYLLWKLRTLEQ